MKIELSQPYSIYELGERPNQEDWIYPKNDEATSHSFLYVLCDGMGGHARGEVASQLVCETVSDYINTHYSIGENCSDNIIIDAVSSALTKLDLLEDSPSFKRMGTTLALVLFYKGGAIMAHVGDSRIYHIRPCEKRIIYKSRDHSLVYDLLAIGDISLDEMKTHPKKNVITRALMPNMEIKPKVDIAHTKDIMPGDYFFMCSDGMLEKMSDEALLSLLSSNEDNLEKCQMLRQSSSDNSDNHSAFLIQISDIIEDESDTEQKHDEDIVKFNAILLEAQQQENNLESYGSETKKESNEISTKKYLNYNLVRICYWIIILILFILLLISKCGNTNNTQPQKTKNKKQTSSLLLPWNKDSNKMQNLKFVK